MMKKTIKIISLVLLVLIALGYAGYRYLNWSFNQPCDPPPKPEGIPVSAKWYGGCDGGIWLEFDSYNEENKRYRFRIYRSYETAMLLDADYILTDECSQTGIDLPTDSTILERIGLAINYQRKIHLSNAKNKNCYLIPVYPAYGGDAWEIIKEKGEYKEAKD